MLLTFVNLFEFLMAVLCFLLGTYVIIKNRPFIFALFLFTMGLQSLLGSFTYLFDVRVFDYRYQLAFLYGPLFYMSIKMQLYENYDWSLKQLFHLVPFVLAIGLKATDIISWDAVGMSIGIVVFTYLFISYRVLHVYSRVMLETSSSSEAQTVKWLRNTLNLVILLGFAQSLRAIFGLETTAGFTVALIWHGSTSLFLVALVIYGMRDSELVPRIRDEDEELAKTLVDDEQNEPLALNKELQGYLDILDKQIKENKPYLDADLKITDFAEQVGCTPRKLASAIKQIYKCTFPEFINQARVEEAKALMNNPYYDDIPIVEIGLQAGFNSKSSFNLMFKRITNETPSNYKRRMIKKRDNRSSPTPRDEAAIDSWPSTKKSA